MTIDEAKTVFLNRGYVEVEGGTIFDANKWREACVVISEWLEQEPCEDAISRQNDILPNIDKEVESYKKLLKHPVVKHIIGLNEEQEQLDFVQPHKRIPVTLTVSDDLISRETVCDYIAEFINHEYSTQSECEMVDSMIEGIQHMPSVKPQESTGHWNLFYTTEHGMREDSYFKCDRCNYESYKEYNFCPNCGARMIEPQERSDKE